MVDKYNGTVLYVLYVATNMCIHCLDSLRLSPRVNIKNAGFEFKHYSRLVLAIDRQLHKTLQMRVWHQTGHR